MSAVAIVGGSGTGKSTSIGNIPEIEISGLNPKETVLINVAGKDLPFKGGNKLYSGSVSANGNLIDTSDAKVISEAIKYISESRKDIKNIVIDDSQFIMAFEFMKKAKESGYGKFADIGVNMSKILDASKNTRKDLTIYFMWHPEKDTDGRLKMKTVGTMIDNYLTLEGLFTVILYAKVDKGASGKMAYQFVTNQDGQYPAKSPIGMFKDLYIKNDLGLVSKLIAEYYN
tara:strand:- start:29033 stop:29719 length:687 start_codon:yes stop_codon:yes gene_type:complete